MGMDCMGVCVYEGQWIGWRRDRLGGDDDSVATKPATEAAIAARKGLQETAACARQIAVKMLENRYGMGGSSEPQNDSPNSSPFINA